VVGFSREKYSDHGARKHGLDLVPDLGEQLDSPGRRVVPVGLDRLLVVIFWLMEGALNGRGSDEGFCGAFAQRRQ
jgi:hypothetical protein